MSVAARDHFTGDVPLTPEMIEAGVMALAEFEDGDGSTLAERVTEVFLHMLSERPKQQVIRDRPDL